MDQASDYAQEHGLPVLLHTGVTFVSQVPLGGALPRHIDEVASRFPEACIIVVRKLAEAQIEGFSLAAE